MNSVPGGKSECKVWWSVAKVVCQQGKAVRTCWILTVWKPNDKHSAFRDHKDHFTSLILLLYCLTLNGLNTFLPNSLWFSGGKRSYETGCEGSIAWFTCECTGMYFVMMYLVRLSLLGAEFMLSSSLSWCCAETEVRWTCSLSAPPRTVSEDEGLHSCFW